MTPSRGLRALSLDPDFLQLNTLEVPFDPLSVLGSSEREAPHTRFLAWLLDPAPSGLGAHHGLGARVLDGVVHRALLSLDALPGHEFIPPAALGPIDPRTVRVLRETPVGDGVHASARAPDLRCLFRDPHGQPWIVMIENKIHAAEGAGQLRAYLSWARKEHPEATRLLVYITPEARPPDSTLEGELSASLAWTDIADLGLEALSREATDTHREARTFARSVLMALRHRFGGDPRVRQCVHALHDRHPRAAALVASPAVERDRIAPLSESHPTAVWHLKRVRPRGRVCSHAWVEAVASAFNLLKLPVTLRAAAPHALCPSSASWIVNSVSQSLSLSVFASPGKAFHRAPDLLWLGLYAPAKTALEAFTEREQLQGLRALASTTRDALLGAVPVTDGGPSWRYLRVGAPRALPKRYAPDEDPRRSAETLSVMLGEHTPSLLSLCADPSLRLYSCDLDPDHVFPTDARDREALHLGARSDAQRVLILGRSPDGHMHHLRREQDLGTALGRAFGSHKSLCYDYSLDALGAPSLVALGTRCLRAPEDKSFDELRRELSGALDRGASLLILGEDGPTRLCEGTLVIHGVDLLAPILKAHPDVSPAHGTFGVSEDLPALQALVTRDASKLGLQKPLSLTAHGELLATFTPTLGELSGLPLAYLARWRAGGARVLYWAGGPVGPSGRALRDQPEALARWWQTITSMA